MQLVKKKTRNLIMYVHILYCAWRVTLNRQIKAVDQENRGEGRREREKQKRRVFDVLFFFKESQGKKKDIVTLLSSIFAKKKKEEFRHS